MNTKKFIAGVLACCAMGGIIPSTVYNNVPCAVTANAGYTYGKYELLTYRNWGSYIEIAYCDETATEVEIPAEIDGLPVTIIVNEAFHDCKSLISVTIPDSVTRIGAYSFYGCSALTSITIPDSVTTIEKSTFSNCSKLSSIEIPESVTNIDTTAFECCSDLKLVTIFNPDCKIYDFASTFSNSIQNTFVNPSAGSIPKINYRFDGTIYGYENSTAQAYAEKYDRKFVPLGKAPETTAELTGDANGDGTVDLADATAIIQYIGNPDKYGLSEQGLANADCNGDGKVMGADALAIQKLEAGLIDKLPYIE